MPGPHEAASPWKPLLALFTVASFIETSELRSFGQASI